MKEAFEKAKRILSLVFISHMVQMKERRLWYSCTNSTTLYPTWFRWKRFCCQGQRHKPALYIPHGSDESMDSRGSLTLHSQPLYPTWFRWKRFCCQWQRHKPSLYIPHGSDERTMKLYELDNHKLLYIPHGSDERFISNTSVPVLFLLYIPHGSDERLAILRVLLFF